MKSFLPVLRIAVRASDTGTVGAAGNLRGSGGGDHNDIGVSVVLLADQDGLSEFVAGSGLVGQGGGGQGLDGVAVHTPHLDIVGQREGLAANSQDLVVVAVGTNAILYNVLVSIVRSDGGIQVSTAVGKGIYFIQTAGLVVIVGVQGIFLAVFLNPVLIVSVAVAGLQHGGLGVNDVNQVLHLDGHGAGVGGVDPQQAVGGVGVIAVQVVNDVSVGLVPAGTLGAFFTPTYCWSLSTKMVVVSANWWCCH